jgi:F-box protein 18 (helicase)
VQGKDTYLYLAPQQIYGDMEFDLPIRDKLSDEQKEILKAFKEVDHIRINAYAGTGKTTTLLSIVADNPKNKFLILTFNKSVAEELTQKIRRYNLHNVDAKTIHGLAYGYFVHKFKGRVKIMDNRDMRDMLLRTGIAEDYSESIFLHKLYEAYCRSEFMGINQSNIRYIIMGERDLRNIALAHYMSQRNKYNENYSFSDFVNDVSKNLAYKMERIYEVLSDHKYGYTTHSHYLKEYQFLVKNQLIANFAYDCVMLDEAQDANGLMLSIIQHLPARKKVIVGDIHQSIYGWNGAVNALARLKDWTSLYLTHSFRFRNSAIAELANKYLVNIKGEKKLIVPRGEREIPGRAIISQTNAKLVEFIINLNESFKTTRPLEVIFSDLFVANKIILYYTRSDSSYLSDLPNYMLEMIKNFPSLFELKTFLETYDYSLKYALDVADVIRSNECDGIEGVYNRARRLYDDRASLTLTTAHSAKGLEWGQVYLAGDFRPLDQIIRNSIDIADAKEKRLTPELLTYAFHENSPSMRDLLDSINLQYVAITRASDENRGTGLSIIQNNFDMPMEQWFQLALR